MNNSDQPQQDDRRESIWSVPLKYRALYFTLFIAFSLVGVSYVAWHETFVSTADSIHDTIMAIMEGGSTVFVASAGTSIIITEATVVIADYLERNVWGPRRERLRERLRARVREESLVEGRAEGREEGRTEGREEGRAEEREVREALSARIQDWNRRRLDAKAKGEPFDEPLPINDGTDSEDDTSP